MARTTPALGDHQLGIYAGGLAGQLPAQPVAWDALERAASDALEPGPRGYLFGGAGTEDTMRANLEAFRRHRIVPRMLRDVTARNLAVDVLGASLAAPVALAPVGVQSILHPRGELESARGAAAAGVPVTASTAAAHTLEEIAEAAGDAPHWFQLYWPSDPELAQSFVQRAERAGYGAIMVTLDTMLLGWRPRDLQGAYLPFLQGTGIANYVTDPVFRASLEAPPEEDVAAAVGRWVQVYSNAGATWADLATLRALTDLPLLVKGVLSADDALLARDAGLDGVVVSNHGGRQVDGALAALDALPAVAAAVGDDLTVLFDSGVRSGADVAKALALGADAVLVGRPAMWGLVLSGAAGVEAVLRNLLAELDLTIALSGRASVAEIGPDLLA